MLYDRYEGDSAADLNRTAARGWQLSKKPNVGKDSQIYMRRLGCTQEVYCSEIGMMAATAFVEEAKVGKDSQIYMRRGCTH